MRKKSISGIISIFIKLFPSQGQVTYVLRTRLPLSGTRRHLLARLACLSHVASVHSEPGSNSPYKIIANIVQSFPCSCLRYLITQFFLRVALLFKKNFLKSFIRFSRTMHKVNFKERHHHLTVFRFACQAAFYDPRRWKTFKVTTLSCENITTMASSAFFKKS